MTTQQIPVPTIFQLHQALIQNLDMIYQARIYLNSRTFIDRKVMTNDMLALLYSTAIAHSAQVVLSMEQLHTQLSGDDQHAH